MDDRRKSPRDEAFLLGEVNDSMVYIGDLSHTGIRMACPNRIAKTNDDITIMIRFPSNILKDIQIKGTVVWHKEKEGVYFYGVEFTNYAQIQENIEQIKSLNDFITDMRRNLLS